jgi:Transposase DNA-binding/Transposase Tn5 dimerisation domain
MAAPDVIDERESVHPPGPGRPPRKAPRQDRGPAAAAAARARRRRAPAPWVELELEGVDLGDKRLNRRLALILSDLAEQPSASIPAACGGKNETTAAYNFFDHDKATADRILRPHYRKTLERIAAQPVAIFVPDTTEVDLTRPQQQVVGAGPLDEGTRFGALVHPLEAFSTDGTPLGAVWSQMWTRDPVPPEDRPKPPRDRKHLPIEEKESFRWLESARRARTAAQEVPGTRCVLVIDSEADIYEVLAEPRGQANPIDWIVRACQDRAIRVEDDPTGTEAARQLWAGVSNREVLFTHEITVRARGAKTECERRKRRAERAGRKATVAVRAARVTLRPPWRPGDRELPPVAVNVVQVREIDPPAGEAPVEWVLVTTLPIDTIEDVRKIITYYTVRWMVEVFFRVLKSGCRIERRRFEHVERSLTFVAVAMIVAWRVLMVCRLGRSCPDLDCEAIFEPSEWKSVYVAVHRRAAPQEPPRLGEMIKLIAQLGGYVNTPGRKDPPGPQTIWQGMQRMSDLAWGWEAFGPESRAIGISEPVPRGSMEVRHPDAPAAREKDT